MYPITEAVKALFESNQTKVLRVTGSTVKKLPTNISVYSGDDLVYQSGDGKLLKLYSGSTEIFDSQGTKTVILYSGDKPIFINNEAGMPIQIEITSDNVRESSFFIDRYSCNGEKLEVGTAIASELKLKLDNAEGQFDGVVFEGAELFVEIGIADWTQANPEITYIPCGYFTPDQQPRSLTTITIEALDRMTKFDAVVDATALTFPATVSGLVGQVCTARGMTLATDLSGLPNASVSIAKLPSVNNVITYRNLIQWCAGIMATNAWVDWNGELRFSWYNNATNYVSTIDNRFTSELYEEDLTITGAEYTNDSGIVLIDGSDDYSIDMSGNALAKDIIATVLPAVNVALNGYAYRPFTASVINAPYLWPMDVVVFKDKNGHDHSGAVTNVGFGLNGSTALESKGLTFKLNKMAAPIGVTRETAQFVNRVTQASVDGLDDELTQQEIFNRLTGNGSEQGLILYNGKLYLNASYISAGTVSADIIKGGTLKLGGENNVNGVFEMYDAQGALKGLWNNSTLSANGSLALNGNSNSTLQFNMGDDGYFKVDSNHVEMLYSPNSNPIYVGFGYIPFGMSRVYYPVYVGNGVSAGDSYNRVIITPTSISMAYGPHDYTQTNVLSVTENQFLYRGSNAIFYGDFLVYNGTKSRVVHTYQYADRLLYCYETPTPLFGDVGEGKIGDDGKCYVWLDPIFAQTITTTQYQVFLQRYGSGECWVSERNDNYFVAEGTPGLAFGWEIKAKQKDYDQRRLDRDDELFTVPTQTYGADAAKYIDDMKKARISV